MKKCETTEQITLFQWAERVQSIVPELSLMYHVPNEGKRTNGGILKAAGLKSGVPDVCLPVPSGKFHALYIELKYGDNILTKKQEEYIQLLTSHGNDVEVCYSALAAERKILDYLDLGRLGKLPLHKCIAAPWIDGKCEGVQMPGRLFSCPECQKCEHHTPTKAEKIISDIMATAPENFKEKIIMEITYLSAGQSLQNATLEDSLEAINKKLVLLVKGKELTVKQSAVVLSVAMDAYYAGKGEKESE